MAICAISYARDMTGVAGRALHLADVAFMRIGGLRAGFVPICSNDPWQMAHCLLISVSESEITFVVWHAAQSSLSLYEHRLNKLLYLRSYIV